MADDVVIEDVPADDAGTILNNPGEDQPQAPVDSWPDEWREKLAGEDEKALNMLKRIADPAGMLKKLQEQEKTIRAGKHKQPLGADATEDQIAEYRQVNGIPEKPDGYLEALDGLVIGDDDRPAVDAFLQAMHEGNAPPAQVKTALDWYYKTIEDKAATEAEADKSFRAEGEDALREAMGADYRANMSDLKGWLGAHEGVLEAFGSARDASGRLIADNPVVINWLVQQMREVNPLATVVPGGGGGAIDTVEGELVKIRQLRRTDRAAYDKNTKMQERERQLLEAQAKHKQRGG